jgi:putative SOS response-associated peptidase YedK
MCGRYTLSKTNLKKRFSTDNNLVGFDASYNITPGSFVPTITRNSPNKITKMHWGLVPEWSKDGKFNMINIRNDTIKTKSYFTSIMMKTRCLIPSDGFYEWKKTKAGGKLIKEPYYFFLKDNPVFSFAGLYIKRTDAEGKKIYTFAIITCEPNFLVGEIHNRMPVILDKKAEETWLNPEKSESDKLLKLLVPFSPAKMAMHKVSFTVNNPGKDGPELINPS